MINHELLIDNLCTQGFSIIDDFLESSSYHVLRELAHSLHQQGLFKNAKIGAKIQAQFNEIRKDETYWLDEDSDSSAVQAYLQQTNALACTLNQSLFLSLTKFETHFAAYQPGSFYKKHVDQFTSTRTRKISCVYYLNDEWQETFGGELKLYNLNDELMATVYPQGNRFICFKSELPHEVCVTHNMRYSIAGWMKTRC